MLILTRRIGESVIIGDDVKITVLGVKGNQVRLGVDAPREVSVHREEIYNRIQSGLDAEQGSASDQDEDQSMDEDHDHDTDQEPEKNTDD